MIVVALIGVLGLGALARLADLLPDLGNPFATERVDRTGPTVLQALNDVHEYRGAVGEFQVVVDLENEATHLPAFVKGERVLFVAIGSVDAGVDFSRLGPEAVELSGDGRVRVTLPRAHLSSPRIDSRRSYVADRDRGLLDRLGAVFSDSPTNDRSLYLAAEARVAEAARSAGLAERAEENTRLMLRSLFRPLGLDVTVAFQP